MESSVKAGRKEGKYFLIMDEKIDELRKKIWSTVYAKKGTLSRCDVTMALALVQYELIHHSEK